MKPTDQYFFVVGAQRCGTSLLRSLLDDHPDIEMAKPFRPEPKWFLRTDRRPGVGQFASELFSPDAAVRWRGEKATSYLEHGEVAGILDREVTDCRIVIVVRDPIERAISNYSYSATNGVEARPIEIALSPASVEPVWDRAEFSVSPYAYLRRSRYIDYIQTYADRFGDRLHVMLFEDLVAGVGLDPLLDWLGVGPATVAKPPRVNGSGRSDRISGALRSELEEWFAQPNAELSELLDVNLAKWDRAGDSQRPPPK